MIAQDFILQNHDELKIGDDRRRLYAPLGYKDFLRYCSGQSYDPIQYRPEYMVNESDVLSINEHRVLHADLGTSILCFLIPGIGWHPSNTPDLFRTALRITRSGAFPDGLKLVFDDFYMPDVRGKFLASDEKGNLYSFLGNAFWARVERT